MPWRSTAEGFELLPMIVAVIHLGLNGLACLHFYIQKG